MAAGLQMDGGTGSQAGTHLVRSEIRRLFGKRAGRRPVRSFIGHLIIVRVWPYVVNLSGMCESNSASECPGA